MSNKRGIFADETTEYAIRRLINQTGTAEGTNLPPRQFGEFRVPFITSLQISKITPLFNQTEFVLNWLNPTIPNISHYNVYAYTVNGNSQQLIGQSTAQASPCSFVVPATNNNTRISFVVQTQLNNGQVSTLDRSPAVTGITRVTELGGGEIEPGTIPIAALANGTPDEIITWDGAGAAVAVTKLAADIVVGASNLNTVGAVPFVVSAGELGEDGSNLFFDDTTNALGVGTATPAATIQAQQATIGEPVHQLSSTASSNSDPTEVVVQNKATTTNATPTVIHTLAIPATTTVGFTGTITARRTGGGGGSAEDGAFYTFAGVYKNVAGTATVIGAGPIVTVIGEDQAAWDVTFNPTSADVDIQVTGAASNQVSWVLTLRVYAVSS